MSASTIEAVSRSPFLDQELGTAVLEAMAAQFRAAKPCPHIHIGAALCSSPDRTLATIPGADWPGWGCFDCPYQYRKLCSNRRRVRDGLKSATWIAFGLHDGPMVTSRYFSYLARLIDPHREPTGRE
jgi:hypothetical protein